MAGGVFSSALLNGMTIRESANDGSDFTNPAADYRRLFLGEDGQLHVKDSAGTVTDIGSSSGIAATIFDAKGDIIAASAADTAARLAVGSNGNVLVADSGESTGLKWARSGTAVGCKVYHSTTQSVTANNPVLFDSEEFDSDGFHSTVTNTNRLTVPSGLGGIYAVAAGGLTSATNRLAPRVNGSTYVRAQGPSGGASTHLLTYVVVQLAAADYVEILCDASVTMGHATNLQSQSWASMMRLGT